MGPPRSGTTIIQKILSAHSKISAIDGETFFFMKRRFDNVKIINLSQDITNKFYKDAKNKIEMFDWIANHIKQENNSEIFLEKTPNHILIIKNLINWFPNSLFLVMLRDGRDGYISSMRNSLLWGGTGPLYPYLWRDSVRAYLEVKNKSNVFSQRYEDLCINPISAISRIMKWIGYDTCESQFDPRVYGDTKISTQRGHERLRRGIDASTIGLWRNGDNKKYIEQFEFIAKKELEILNYK